MKHKALVLGTNYYIGLSVARSLGRKGVYVISVDHDEPNPYGRSRYVKEALIGPHYRRQEEDYLKFLLDLASREEEKMVLFPTADPYVEFVDRNFEALKEHFLFPQREQGLLTGLMDKSTLLRYTKAQGVRTPEQIDGEEVDLVERVREEIGYPCILKPKDSPSFVKAYRRKVYRVETEEELKDLVAMCRRDGHGIFIQRIIPGPETNCYCYDAYLNQEGKVVCETSAYKIRQWPPHFGASTLTQQKWIPELEAFCKPFLEGIGFRGFVEIELKRDEFTGEIYLIEVNVRYINFTEMLVDIGMDPPYRTYREMTGEHLTYEDFRKDFHVKWRYLLEDISAKRAYRREGYSAAELRAQEKGDRIVPSTFAWDDPWPGTRYAIYHVVKALKRRVLRLRKGN